MIPQMLFSGPNKDSHVIIGISQAPADDLVHPRTVVQKLLSPLRGFLIRVEPSRELKCKLEGHKEVEIRPDH